MERRVWVNIRAQLAADGFASERIRKYGFAFQGKKCMMGCKEIKGSPCRISYK